MKVLLISHNPISTFNNMGKTFLTMFSAFSRDELCQIYVRPTTPDVKMCSSYYQITDKQALKSLFFAKPGGEVSEKQIEKIMAEREKGELPVPAPPVGTKSHLLLIRDIVWKLSRWYSKDLRSWIERENPTCIFLAPGYSAFIYYIALKIAEDYNLPVITYICDDYYFVNKPQSLIGKWQFSMLCKSTERIMNRTSELVVISEEIKDVYHKVFKVPAEVLMTGADVKAINKCNNQPVSKISYFGNLSDGRNKSLAEIGQALDIINSSHGTEIALNIYSNENSSDILCVFNGIESVRLCGFVSGNVFEEAFESSDILIHTESFEEKHIDRVKHSVSTKIADSLASGIPLFAYGPDSISSMKHLLRNDCAFVAVSRDQLVDKLTTAVFDKATYNAVSSRAVEVAARFHDNKVNSSKLRSIIAHIAGE